MRAYVGSLGCKLNQSEMEALADRLTRAGHKVVGSPIEADVCILNTCAVTHVAAQKSRQALRRLHRENPQARLIAAGCYAELAPAALQDLPGVALVVGNQEKGQLTDLLEAEESANGLTSDGKQDSELGCAGSGTCLHSRALVKIQDGCDNACTYCIVRLARGPQRSRPADEVLQEVRCRVAAGHPEIVLTGVHIGAYGRDRQGHGSSIDLWGLVARILSETAVRRLRLSSIEPWDLSGQVFNLWENPRLCRHLHLPLQSGCDDTLRRMGRRYTADGFAALVAQARDAIPGLAITTDVIAGFPGETDEEFAQSLRMLRAMRFARVHVFPFSPRPGTLAAAMPDQVPPSVKSERARALRAVGAASGRAFQQGFVGQAFEVLWESPCDGATGRVWSGLTDNYLRVFAESSANLANTLTCTRLTALVEGGLKGEIEI